MILELDAGNSRLKWRMRGGAGDIVQRGSFDYDESTALVPALTDLGEQIDATNLAAIKVGSVAANWLGDALQRWAKALNVPLRFARTSAECASVRCCYANPESLGIDRWLAMVAAYNKVQRAVFVIDSGTALTLDFVDASGQHQGGLIMPGLRPLQDAVATHMSKVPFEPGLPQQLVLGDSTQSAVVNGTGFMLLGSLEAAIRQQLEAPGEEPEIFITGGDAEFIGHYLSRPSIFTADLVLDGLEYVLP